MKSSFSIVCLFLLCGCKPDSAYDFQKMLEQSRKDCLDRGGIITGAFLKKTTDVVETSCVNPKTGNTFIVYSKGVLK